MCQARLSAHPGFQAGHGERQLQQAGVPAALAGDGSGLPRSIHRQRQCMALEAVPMGPLSCLVASYLELVSFPA